MVRARFALAALSMVLGGASASAEDAPPDAFALHDLTRAPFEKVQVWAPPAGTPGRFETLVVLHGNQPGAADPTWLVGLHFQSAFARRILIVPALKDGGYEFGAPRTAAAIAALVDDVARKFPVDRGAVFVVGYSAGASRVLPVARRLSPVAGIVAVAGDVARPLRDRKPSLDDLRAVPLLLVCMNDDPGPHTNCALNEANRALVARLGLRRVELRRLPGTHSLDLAALAPLLHEWLARAPR
jgi:poly(3-hydroxybutyrate) depolymerase